MSLFLVGELGMGEKVGWICGLELDWGMVWDVCGLGS